MPFDSSSLRAALSSALVTPSNPVRAIYPIFSLSSDTSTVGIPIFFLTTITVFVLPFLMIVSVTVVPASPLTYSAASSNAMSGKAVASAVSGKANDADLATVAKSGSFTDLINKPTIDTTLSSTSTNAVENKAIKAALDGKQASINDLGTIRSNATAGKGAADTIATYGDIVSHNANEFQAAGDYALASDIPTKVSELQNDANYVKNVVAYYRKELDKICQKTRR